MKVVYIFDAVRTPRGVGSLEGALYAVKPIDLVKTVLKAIERRNQLTSTEIVDDLLLGCITPIKGQGGNIARTSLMHAGWNEGTTGIQLNSGELSALSAITLGCMKIQTGQSSVVVAGGIESSSRIPEGSDGGAFLQDTEFISEAHYLPMGIIADLKATVYQFDKAKLDEYGQLSRSRALSNNATTKQPSSLIPIYDRNDLLILPDEEYLQTLRPSVDSYAPAFEELGNRGFDAVMLRHYPLVERIQHFHTIATIAPKADGSAALLLGNQSTKSTLKRTPRAKITTIATAHSNNKTSCMAALAAQQVLQKAKLTTADIDLWECNEPYAANVLRFQEILDIPIEHINVDGGAIALGQATGAIGAIMISTLLDALEKRNLSKGIVAIGTSTGLGEAILIERVGKNS